LIDSLKPALSDKTPTKFAAMPDGYLLVTLSDWPTFLNFKAEYQASTCTDYYSNQTSL